MNNKRTENQGNREGGMPITRPGIRPSDYIVKRPVAGSSGNSRKAGAVSGASMQKDSHTAGSVSSNNTTQHGTGNQNASRREKIASQAAASVSEKSKAASAADRAKFERMLAEEKMKKKNAYRARLRYFLSVFVLFLTVLSLLAAVGVSAFFIALSSHGSAKHGIYELELCNYDTDKNVKGGFVVLENGEKYADFSSFAEFCGFAMVGSIDKLKYIVKGDTDETLAFDVGTDKAYVNGVAVRMSAASYVKNDDLYVPIDFVERYAEGIELTVESDKLTINRLITNQVDANGKITDGKAPEYETVGFILKEPAVSASISEDDSSVTMPMFSFISDLSDYEQYMNPGSTTEFLNVVNKTHKLSEDYIPTGLSSFDSGGETFYLKQYAAEAFKALIKEASANGINGLIVSKAYIGYDELSKNYNALINEYIPVLGETQAKRYAETVTSLPGEDEHQTGLLITFASGSDDAAGRSAMLWLRENSDKFGFVERYPQSKSDVTGHMFSSDDYRFVGRYHAVRMKALGMCLDEYAEYLGV